MTIRESDIQIQACRLWQEAHDAEAAVRHDLETVRLDNQRTLEQARRYREDPATLEELARRDLGLIKFGEKLFIIRDLPPAQPR